MAVHAPQPGRIRRRSPVAGLQRRRLSGTAMLAQSIAAVAPSAAMVTLPAIVISDIGSSAVGAFAAATGIVLLVGYCLSHFAHRMSSASGLYSYAAKGLGPDVGFLTGWALLIGYFAAASASALACAVYLSSFVDVTGLGLSTSTGSIAAAIIVIAGLAGLLMRGGIRFSARVSLGLEVVSTALVIGVLTLLAWWSPGTGSRQTTLPTASLDATALGVVLAVTSFVGFESAGTLGVETRRPLVTVPRALRWTPLLLGGLYLLAALAQVHLFRTAPLALLQSATPVIAVATARGDQTMAAVLDLGIAASFFACLVGSGSAFVRVVFSMSREGLLPEKLSRTHQRYGSPYVAIATFLPFWAGVPLLLLIGGDSPRDALVVLLTLSALGYLVSYALVCLATPAFLWRIGELTLRPLLAGALAFVTMGLVIGWALANRFDLDRPTAVVFVSLLAAGVVALGALRSRGRDALSRIGVYDETIVEDLFVGTTTS
jgi:amino acid transporter